MIIAATTNKGQIYTQHIIREQPKTMVKVVDLIKTKGVPITSYDYPNSGHVENCWKNPCPLDYDRLWHVAGPFTVADMPQPN